ncbi:hypothetical protein PINS_up014435 [Pythium insidiosum]|nr:hypothetical protein PINS_up014435 [Pythium insidiosum]
MSTSKDQDGQLSERERFYRFCLAHITARDEGGYITSQASRLLLKYVRACLSKLPQHKCNFEEVTRKAIDRCPVRRIDLDALERFELVMRSTEYAWEPTWEPVTNIPKSALKKYRDKKHDMRAIRGRSAAIMAQATSTRKNRFASKRKLMRLERYSL